MKHRRKVFTKGPADAAEGDHASPLSVTGVPVTEVLLVQAELSAALVRLEDERFAITGSVVAVGSAHDVSAYARRHALASSTDRERAWFAACMDRLADLRAQASPSTDEAGEPA